MVPDEPKINEFISSRPTLRSKKSSLDRKTVIIDGKIKTKDWITLEIGNL